MTETEAWSFAQSAASNPLNEIAAALAKAQPKFAAAAKNKTNPHLKSKYADLVSVTEAVKAPLAEAGLSYTQVIETDKADVICNTLLMHTSGQWINGRLTLHSKDTSAQAMGSAITYARRYGLSAMLGIVTDEEDDGDASQEKPAKKAAQGDYKHISVSEPKPAAEPKAKPEPKTEHQKLEQKAQDTSPGSKTVESTPKDGPASDETKNLLWGMVREVWEVDTKNCLNGSLKNSGKKPVDFKTLTNTQAAYVKAHLDELLNVAVDEVPF